MIVVDTNILAGLYFDQASSSSIEDLKRKTPDWIAPSLWRSEFINVATAYYRKNLIAYDDALNTIQEAILLMDGREVEADVDVVFSFVKTSKCSSYDCHYIALAHQLNLKLITYDKQLLSEFPSLANKPEDYLAQLQ